MMASNEIHQWKSQTSELLLSMKRTSTGMVDSSLRGLHQVGFISAGLTDVALEIVAEFPQIMP
jgi:hypothetical protein